MYSKSIIMTSIKISFPVLAVVLFLITLTNQLRSENPGANVEIFLTNNTSSIQSVNVTPIGMIFNDLHEYSLTSSSQHRFYRNKSITGIEINVPAGPGINNYPIVDHVATEQKLEGQPDITQDHLDNHIGYGKYRIQIGDWGYVDVDFSDSDYSYASGLNNDIFLRLEPSGDLYWEGAPDLLLTPNQDLLEIWDQARIGGGSKTQNKDGFIIPDVSETVPQTNLPLGTHTDADKLFVNADVKHNITVISGKTFAPTAGTTLKFDSNVKLTVNGTLNANGTSSQPITFDRSGISGTWGGIKFNSGSNGTVDFATIKNAAKGVKVSSTNNVTVSNSTLTNFTEQAVYASNSSLTVNNCTIQNPSGASHGIYLLGAGTPTITNNTIDGISIGIERKDSPGNATISHCVRSKNKTGLSLSTNEGR